MWCSAEVIGRDAIDGVCPPTTTAWSRSCATEQSGSIAPISSRIRAGGRCCSVIVTPNGASASSMALHKRRRRHDHPALADAAEVDVRIERHRLEMVDLDARDLGRGGQQVVHERAGEELRLVVVRRPLEQHRADALGDAAAHLALDDGGVDQRAAVLDDDVALDRHLTGLDVDLDDRAVGAARPAALAAVERTGRFERVVGRAAAATSAKRDRARRARPARRPCRRRSRGRRHSPRADRPTTSRICSVSARAVCSVAPPAIVAARLPPVPKPERRAVAVADDDPDLLERHADLVGRDLGERRLVALPVRHLRR